MVGISPPIGRGELPTAGFVTATAYLVCDGRPEVDLMRNRQQRWGGAWLVRLMVVMALAATAVVAAPAAAGAQTQQCNGLTPTIVAVAGVPTFGTGGSDVILGTRGRDVINGRGGDDTICSLGGADVVNAGAGDDVVLAGGGADLVRGGRGSDLILGQGGRDDLRGAGWWGCHRGRWRPR